MAQLIEQQGNFGYNNPAINIDLVTAMSRQDDREGVYAIQFEGIDQWWYFNAESSRDIEYRRIINKTKLNQ